MVPLLKQNRRMVHKHTIQQRVETDSVLSHVRFYFVSEIVVYGISHIVGLELLNESFLIDLVIFEHFTHNVESAPVFVGVETQPQYLLFAVGLLVGENKVENFLNQAQTVVKNNV